MSKRTYKITDKNGVETITDSLNAFAKEVGVYYGQFYTALHKGRKTTNGNYKVEWYNPEDGSDTPTFKFKITDPIGIVHEVDSYKSFAKSIGVKEHGFKSVLRGLQKTCYGGYTIERNGVPNKEEVMTTTSLDNTPNSTDITLLDVINEGNTHKVKYRTSSGNMYTRKVEIKRVDNLTGVKCDFSNVIIPMKGLYATCGQGKDKKVFSVDQIKNLGYEFNIDFDFNTKVVEKKVEVFTPERLEEVWLEKMDKVTKEIAAVQKKLTQLKEAKEYIGQSLSQTKAMNERLSVADNYLKKLL